MNLENFTLGAFTLCCQESGLFLENHFLLSKIIPRTNSLCFNSKLHMKTVFSTTLWCVDGSLYWVNFIMLKYDFTFKEKIKFIDWVSKCVYLLIPLILFKFKKLSIVSYFFAQSSEYWKVLNNLGHFLKVHTQMINVIISILRILNLNINAFLSYLKLNGFCCCLILNRQV